MSLKPLWSKKIKNEFYINLCNKDTLTEAIKGGLLQFSRNSPGQNEQKCMKYINIVENLNEIGQISLITFCTAKLHRYLRIK